MYKKRILRIIGILFVIVIYLYLSIYTAIPDKLTMIEGREISYPFYDFVTISFEEGGNVQTVGNNLVSSSSGNERVKLSLFGVIPLKTVDIHVISEDIVIAGGDIIGMKLNTEGLTVVTFEEFTTRDYSKSRPYEGKNVQRGDAVIKINDKAIINVDDFINELQLSGGNTVKLQILRGKNAFEEYFTPEIDRNDGKYKLGIWVKNITSGVGTVTYINPSTGNFGALGHGINDIDESNLLKISGGEAYNAMVLSISKGKKGAPGEIHGAMRENDIYGQILKNTKCGVFGSVFSKANAVNKEYPIGLKNEVTTGMATILSAVSGNECREYKIKIDKINYNNDLDVKGMVIKITDSDLLSATGGIVQGMSGSPIIQNGKLIGAITHVLINDPTRGYGIFIESMLEEEAA